MALLKQYLNRFKQIESKIKKARTTISPQYLCHHFLIRASLDHLIIRSILAMVNLENDEEVLKKIQKKYEDIVMEQKNKKAFYGTRNRTRSRSFTSTNTALLIPDVASLYFIIITTESVLFILNFNT